MQVRACGDWRWVGRQLLLTQQEPLPHLSHFNVKGLLDQDVGGGAPVKQSLLT